MGGALWTLGSTAIGVNNENRKVYIKEINSASGDTYYIPLNKGIEQVSIRCMVSILKKRED